jgi:hypothetical protein
MRRTVTIAALVIVPLVALGVWIARNTYWEEIQVPLPLEGEARTNPFYAAARFAGKLGAQTSFHRALSVPAPDAVIVVSGWHWGRSARQREALEQWVESGGRLVADDTLLGSDAFAQWSGIVRAYRDTDDTEAESETKGFQHCRQFTEATVATASEASQPAAHARKWLCDFDWESSLHATRRATWVIREGSNNQAIRVTIGRGSVTIVNGSPFVFRGLFDGDHGWLLVAATELQRGDVVQFLTEADHPSLLALIWRHGASLVILTLVIIGMVLWRGAVRLGPMAPLPARGRRSLAEQIRGSGQFTLRYGDGEPLHAASVRALEETAARRISGYARLPKGERAAAIAALGGFDRHSLAKAMYHSGLRNTNELGDTLTVLETARRRLLLDHT